MMATDSTSQIPSSPPARLGRVHVRFVRKPLLAMAGLAQVPIFTRAESQTFTRSHNPDVHLARTKRRSAEHSRNKRRFAFSEGKFVVHGGYGLHRGHSTECRPTHPRAPSTCLQPSAISTVVLLGGPKCQIHFASGSVASSLLPFGLRPCSNPRIHKTAEGQQRTQERSDSRLRQVQAVPKTERTNDF
jgi:hypothetical protein